MKKTILLFILFSFTFLTARSQTKQESIKELIHIMQIDSMFKKMVLPDFSLQKDSAVRAKSQEMLRRIKPKMDEILNKMINEDMIVLYDKYYTQKEINDLIKFYQTETGKKIISVSPKIQNETMQMMNKKYMPEIMKLIMDTKDVITNDQPHSSESTTPATN